MSERKLSAENWLKEPAYEGIVVYDPDGWDRSNFDVSWAEKITEEEFNKRLATSTCLWPKGFLEKMSAGC
jgi:hypothetical protein